MQVARHVLSGGALLMGRAKRVIPKRLGEKLYKIRENFDLTLEELIEKLNCPELALYPASISMYESGKREPPLVVLLRYARLANIIVDVLIDDEMDLPVQIPNPRKK
jgi:transcriptional regulator with XRE-family HTH domain